MRWWPLHNARASAQQAPSVTTKEVTLGLYLEALFVAGKNENEAFDPIDEDVSVETCRRLCALLFEDFPERATDEGLRRMAALGWRLLEKTKAEALEWAQAEQAIHARIWGSPSGGAGLPLTDYLFNLTEEGVVAYCTLLDRPLWQAFVWLYASGVSRSGHAANRKMKAGVN